MYVSATDQEKLGQVTTSVYRSTEEVLAFLLFMYADISCFVSVSAFVSCGKIQIYCIQTVYKMVLGISREKTSESLSLLILQLSLGKNLILLTLLDSNIHKHENFKLTLFYMDTCFIIH